MSCSYDENGIKKKVTCPFVVEDGVGHFEEDEIVGNQTNQLFLIQKLEDSSMTSTSCNPRKKAKSI